jgi:hypothetical protein
MHGDGRAYVALGEEMMASAHTEQLKTLLLKETNHISWPVTRGNLATRQIRKIEIDGSQSGLRDTA